MKINIARAVTMLLAGALALAQPAAAQRIGSTGFSVTPTGGTTASTLAAITGRMLTPFDFGATGNGIADDRAAVNACLATGYCFIPVPSGGFYRIRSVSGDSVVYGPVTVTAGGTGAAVGDVITLTGGTCGREPTITVTAVSSGAVTSAIDSDPGDCATAPGNPVAQGSTTGVGTGATFTLTWTQLAVVQPSGASVVGQGMIAGNPPGGTIVKCDTGIVICWTVGGVGQTTGATSLSGVTVEGGGTSTANSRAIYVAGGFNPQFDHVNAMAAADCVYLKAWGTTGISWHSVALQAHDCSHDYVVIDSWPEAYSTDARLGTNGSGDVAANAYVGIIGGTNKTPSGLGPNTVSFLNSQFNASTGPSYWLDFNNMLGGGVTALIFRFIGGHVEGVATADIHSDANTSAIDRLQIIGITFNDTGAAFAALNGATEPSVWEIVGNVIAGGITLAPASAQISGLSLTDNRIIGGLSLTGTSGSTASISDNSLGANSTLAGAWGSLSVVGNSFTAGSLTDSSTGGHTTILSGLGGLTKIAAGNVIYTGSAPTSLSGCGTGATIVGNDRVGAVTIGTTPGAACSFAFAGSWTTAPICLAQDQTTGNLLKPAATTTGLTLTGTLTANDQIGYECSGYQ